MLFQLRSVINLHTGHIFSAHLICEEYSTNAINCNAGHATGRSFPAIKVSLTTYADNKVASKDIRASLDVLTSGCWYCRCFFSVLIVGLQIFFKKKFTRTKRKFYRTLTPTNCTHWQVLSIFSYSKRRWWTILPPLRPVMTPVEQTKILFFSFW